MKGFNGFTKKMILVPPGIHINQTGIDEMKLLPFGMTGVLRVGGVEGGYIQFQIKIKKMLNNNSIDLTLKIEGVPSSSLLAANERQNHPCRQCRFAPNSCSSLKNPIHTEAKCISNIS